MSSRILAITTLLGISVSLAGTALVGRDPHLVLRAAARIRVELTGAEFLGADGVILQTSLNDCGPAALANLLAHLGRPVSAATLAPLAGTAPRGTRLGGLADAAAAVGVRATAMRLTDARRAPDQLTPWLPIVAWVDRGHFVTITRQRPGGDFVVLDPQVGAYALAFDALVARWTGEALVLE